jgi:glycolate oxidase iron-sulfur subunit
VQDADSCVMCGMCQPHCPTYQIYRNEAESPRGRISIIQACAQGRLTPDNTLLQHLEHCLGCMACEAMCPSNVAFGRLIDNAQALLAQHKTKTPFTQKLLLNRVALPGGIKRYSGLLRWYNKTGLQTLSNSLLQLTGIKQAARANNMLRLADTTHLLTFYPAQGPVRADLALFTGCLGTSFDATTLLSSIKILTRLGFNLHIPANQYCCGALHQHQGQPAQSKQLTQQNRTLFSALPVTHILYTANGCGAQLAQASMPVPVMDIANFILTTPTLATCHFKPLDERVYIHESCSSLNKLKIHGITQKLLQHIPRLQCFDAGKSPVCCGAGSNHTLQFPDLAQALAQLKIHTLNEIRPKYLLSDNLGCSLHMKNTFKESGLTIEVMHPITLLAQQLD